MSKTKGVGKKKFVALLLLHKHIATVSGMCKSGGSAKSKFLPRHALIPAYYSLIYSHLQYAIMCWDGTSKT